jgi:hypothetical protein
MRRADIARLVASKDRARGEKHHQQFKRRKPQQQSGRWRAHVCDDAPEQAAKACGQTHKHAGAWEWDRSNCSYCDWHSFILTRGLWLYGANEGPTGAAFAPRVRKENAMRGFDQMKQESVKPQGFSDPSAGRAALLQAPCANAVALCKTANREMQSQMQIAKRFANQRKATKQINRSTLMTVRNKIAALAFVVLSATAASGAAQAQLALQNGAFVSTSGSQTTGSGITSLNLGDAGSYTNITVVNMMPMSLTYGSVTTNISFTGQSVLVDGGGLAPSANNYLLAQLNGSVTLDFSQTQRYFATRWMTQDSGNTFSFYNNNQLVASTTGAAVKPMSIASTGTISSFVDFNFTELGYDRVVVTGAIAGAVEFGEITFSGDVQAAPIPLNAASLGGLMSFLMMLAMRGKGGTQVAIRVALASITPRRRTLA